MRLSNVPLVAGVTFALVSMASPAKADDAAQKVEPGASIYGDYCSSCHGEQLRNTSGGVTFDLRKLRPEDQDRFAKAVLDGKGPMPPWRGVLKPEQIEAIWADI